MKRITILTLIFASLWYSSLSSSQVNSSNEMVIERLWKMFKDCKRDEGSIREIKVVQISNDLKEIFVYKPIAPSIPDRFIHFPDGAIMPVDERGLREAFRYLYSPSKEEQDHLVIIDDIIKRYQNRGYIVIKDVADIQKYEKSKMDPDLEKTIVKPFNYKDDEENIIYVTYIYQPVGGIVKRFRFTFKEGKWIDAFMVSVLATGIGEPTRLRRIFKMTNPTMRCSLDISGLQKTPSHAKEEAMDTCSGGKQTRHAFELSRKKSGEET